MSKRFIFTGILGLFFFHLWSQVPVKTGKNAFWISGKFQSDMLTPQTDKAFTTGIYDSKFLSNTWFDLILSGKNFDAGGRFEMYKKPMPGFESAYEGAGIPFFYFSGRCGKFQIIAGNFYEQFGSGLIFRTYEERSLGLDNSLQGGLLAFKTRGITLKALGGRQRYYWDFTGSWVYGWDAGLNMEEWLTSLKKQKIRLLWGTSWVGKYQQTEDIWVSLTEKLNLPEKVGAFATRLRIQKGKFNIFGEFAVKANDPSIMNHYIYKNGTALFLSGTYARKGLGLLLQARRNDNMFFKSQRTEPGRMLYINHLPSFTKQHAYALAALYPYATQPGGEWAFQSELNCLFDKDTKIGGPYGTVLKINFSRIHSIDKEYPYGTNAPLPGTGGYHSDFWRIGKQLYYQDLNFEISGKLNRNFSITGMYMNQSYNQEVMEGHAVKGRIIHSDIFVMEGKYLWGTDKVLRSELQYLHTKQDQRDWIFGLMELSVSSSWMFTVSDMVNNGITNLHYYMASVVYSQNAHRLQLSWGRTRAGFNCAGGVCRYVPAYKGLQLSYLMSF